MTDDYAPLLYDDGLTDDDPQLVVIMSSGWLAYVRGAFERLLSLDTWDTASDIEAAVSQAYDAMARLIGVPVSQAIAYPWNIWLNALAAEWYTAGGETPATYTSQVGGGYWFNTTPVLNESILGFTLALGAGEHEIQIFCVTASSSGKFRWYLDGGSLDPAQIMDMYSVAVTYNVRKSCTFTITESGEHYFEFVNAGKHASSSNYYIAVTGFALTRTA